MSFYLGTNLLLDYWKENLNVLISYGIAGGKTV